MKINKKILATVQSHTAGPIPKIIHQTFETNDIAPGMHDAAMSWVKHNPDFDYHFYDNTDRRETIAKHFDQGVLDAYDWIEHGAFRADLWRYCQLYVDGGIYADIDTVCMSSMSELVGGHETFITARAGNLKQALFNGFICVQPGHPFMKAAIDRAVKLTSRKETPFDGYMITGPGNLGFSVNISLGLDEDMPHTYGNRDEAGFAFRILIKARSDSEHAPFVTDGDQILLYTDYEGYRDDLISQGLEHWQDKQQPQSVLGRVERRVKQITKKLLKFIR